MIPASANPMMMQAAAAAPAGDVVTKSVRFNDGDTPYLQRTTGTSSDQTKCTHSFWMKRSTLGANQRIFEGGSNAGFLMNGYGGSDEFRVNNNGPLAENTTTQLLRDTSAFYHICVSINSALSSADQLKLYINGTRVTSFSRTDSIETDQALNPSGTYATIGKAYGGGEHFDGYLADYYMLDGVAAAATDFAEEDATTGQWKPKAYSGTYGDNGFHLDFNDSSDIGKDVSGEGNNFTATNLAASDVVNDCPTENYCVINPLDKYSGVTLAEGNLKLTSGDYHYARSTFALPSSKQWYWEYYWKDHGYLGGYGISAADYDLNNGPTGKCRMTMGGSWYTSFNSGGLTEFCADQARYGGTNWGTTYEDGDIVMVAVDMDNSKIWFGKNGSWISTSGTPNPATGVDPRNSSVTSTTDWFPTVGTSATYGGEVYANYGQDPFFAGNKASGQDTSQSEFYYAPPSGYLSLSTGNLPTPTIAKPAEHFNTVLYSGTGDATQNITGVGFSPDLVWIKNRNTSLNHYLVDSVRGLNYLFTNTSGVEGSSTGRFNSFHATDGFQVEHDHATSGGYTNGGSQTYVAWNWKKSVTAGFNIVGWTGDDDSMMGSAQTITHGLNPLTPEMIIAKGRTDNNATGSDWLVYHKDLSSGEYLILNDNGSTVSPMSAVIDNIGATTVDFGSDNSSYYLNTGDMGMGSGADTYIGYFFASVEGYSKCGSYEGNYLADGAFVYCGFRPAFVMMKDMDATRNWHCYDNKREGYNVNNDALQPNTSNSEQQDADLDFLSNGFKLRRQFSQNYSSTYIFYAVAESPLKYGNAR